MSQLLARRLALSALVVSLVTLLFVACGVPDPATQSATDLATTPTVLAAASAASADSTPTATTEARCPDLLMTVEAMDRATLEQCVAVETTALAQVAPTCPADFDLSAITDEALGMYCHELRETADALQIVGTLLLPTVVTPTETPFAGTVTPPNYIPDESKVVEPVPGEDRIGLRFLRGATSVWQLGALSDVSGYGYESIWVWTKPPGTQVRRATIRLAIMGDPDTDTGHGPIYRMVWEAPEDVGAITITRITDATTERDRVGGLIAFTTESGGSGTFDLATQQWTFVP